MVNRQHLHCLEFLKHNDSFCNFGRRLLLDVQCSLYVVVVSTEQSSSEVDRMCCCLGTMRKCYICLFMYCIKVAVLFQHHDVFVAEDSDGVLEVTGR